MKEKIKVEKEKQKYRRDVYTDIGLVRTLGDDEDIVENESSGDEEKNTSLTVDPIVAKQRKKSASEVDRSATVSFADLETSVDAIASKASFSPGEKWMRGANVASTHRTACLEEQIRKARVALASARSRGFEQADEDEDFENELLHADDEFNDVIKTKRKRSKKAKESSDDANIKEEELDKFEIVDAQKLAKDGPCFFSSMNLSRPLLRALTDTGFSRTTPIQSACIPLALAGRDICACAATGTGKTFAFMLPILERLILRPQSTERATRVLVLAPTRELAVQVYDVTRQLARYLNDIEMVVSAGGFDLKAQEAALRRRPDIVIATPGRLIDHLQNALGFSLQHVEILVLDEADRMLDEFFAEQMKEIIRLCSPIRQTMLFSATMTEAVRDLATVSLNNPLKVFVNTNSETGDGLSQEFIRIRPKREADREAILAALLSRTLRADSTVVFVQTKRLAHRLHVQLGLIGLRVAELHSSLTQAQRSESLRRFKTGEVNVLIASDLAARGLDMEGIDCVVNMTLPATLAHYIHRVGRTARAGRRGRSVSFVGEDERSLLKDVRKAAKGSIHWRVIPTSVIDRFRYRLADLESTIEQILADEKTEREIQAAQTDADRASNRLKAERLAELTGSEPVMRRKRSWFQSGKEKEVVRESQKLAQFERAPKGRRDNRKKPSQDKKAAGPDERLQHELAKAQQLAKRISKRHGDPSAIVSSKKGSQGRSTTTPGDEGDGKAGKKRKSGFSVDYNEVSAREKAGKKKQLATKTGKGGKIKRPGAKGGPNKTAPRKSFKSRKR